MAVPNLQDAIDHLQEKNLDAAISALERKIDELPAHLTAHVLLGRAYEAKHDWTKALECWENVYFLMPNSPVGQRGKARVLRRLDREEEAEEAEPTAEDGLSSSSEQEADSPSPVPSDSKEEPLEDEASTSPTGAASELEELRRRAEKEARERKAAADHDESSSPSETPVSHPETPEECVGQLEEEDNDLDRLIDELESARIEPRPDVDEVPAPDLENDVDDLVSETLARIHEAQDHYRKAAQIYVKLASQEPDRARDFLEKAAEMRERAEEQA